MKQLLMLALLLVLSGPTSAQYQPNGNVPVNKQIGTSYPVVNSDRGKLVTFTNGSAISVTLPLFSSGWHIWIQNRGVGTVTIDPAGAITIDGDPTLPLTTGQGVLLSSDGSNYYSERGVGGGGSFASLTGSPSDNASLQSALDAKQNSLTFGTGVQTALGVNVGSAGAPVLFNGAGGTPSSLTVTNATGTASININGTVGATTPAAVAATTVAATSPANGSISLTVKGNGAGQTADLMQALDTDGSSVRFRLSNKGLIGSRGMWMGAGFAGDPGYDVLYFGNNTAGQNSWAFTGPTQFRGGSTFNFALASDPNGIGTAGDVNISRISANVLGVGTGAQGSVAGSIQAAAYLTGTNCSDSAGAAACGSASAGSVVIDAAATTVVVSTTAVTANSQIFVTFDSSLGTRLGVTCNTNVAVPVVTARTAGSSFTIGIDSGPITDPACFSFHIIN